MGRIRQEFNDMFYSNGKLDFARVLTFVWFVLCFASCVIMETKKHEITEPLASTILNFEMFIFMALLSLCGFNVTSWNVKNLKDGFNMQRTDTNTSTTTTTTPDKPKIEIK